MAYSFLYSKFSSLFQESKTARSNSVPMGYNGVVTNGKSSPGKSSPVINGKRSPFFKQKSVIPTVEITDSPTNLHRRVQKSSSTGSLSATSEESRSPDHTEIRPSSAGSRAAAKDEERDNSDSPTQTPLESIMSPGRRATVALKRVSDMSLLYYVTPFSYCKPLSAYQLGHSKIIAESS